jgi:hypothetical protein
LSIPRTFTFRKSNRKPTRLTFTVAGTTATAAALVAVGLATASPSGAGATAALSAALATHGGTSALPLVKISLAQTDGALEGEDGHASAHVAAGIPAVTASGRAILASGLAATQAAARPGKSGPASRPGNRAPAGHPAKAAGQHASGARPARHWQLDGSARNAQHAAPAQGAQPAHHASPRRTGPCASSTLHWWICSAEHALEEHGVSRGLLSTTAAYIVVQHESGGNPGAYNGWDSNAAAGHPSEGIAQVIGPTFQAYALPGHHNIWNPVDNMIAAFRYAISRYGSMNNIPGVLSVRQGGSYMGY